MHVDTAQPAVYTKLELSAGEAGRFISPCVTYTGITRTWAKKPGEDIGFDLGKTLSWFLSGNRKND